ncbi:MAG: hypothetical protein HY849_00145 [Nitrosomonadales bacterium]|nr:hypothetical protein [Nitrosomonadales bacterium]
MSTVDVQDALNAAIDCNKGLDALISLMMATSQGNAPSMDCLAELISSLQRDMQQQLLDIIRSIETDEE